MSSASPDATPACPLCRSHRVDLIHDQPDSRYFPRRIHRCRDCGFGFVSPLPDAGTLSGVYNDANYFHDPDQQFTEAPPGKGVLKRAVSRARWLQQRLDGGRLLDVGCAEGVFLTEAAKNGFSISGVELSRYAAELARKRTGATIHTDDIAELSSHAERYDILTLWDVIEHVSDPHAFLGHCRALLAPGGHIVLSTPNQHSYNGRLKGDNWKGYWTGPEHLYFYNRHTLSRLLADCGFRVTHHRTCNIAPVLMRWATRIGWGGDLEVIARRTG